MIPRWSKPWAVIKQLWDSKGMLQNPGGNDIYGDEMAVLLKKRQGNLPSHRRRVVSEYIDAADA